MKTNQIMESIDRELCGRIIRQRTKDSFMRLWDIEAIGKLYRLQNNLPEISYKDWLATDNVKEFLTELEAEIGTNPYIKSTKSNSGWVHPFFAIKILTHFNPKFEVQVYKWLFDSLIQSRIDGGDSYNKMCGALYKYASRKDTFAKNIKIVATRIRELVGVDDWNNATKEQLSDRDYLQNMIADLAVTLKDSNQGLKYGIEAYKAKQRGEL